LSRTYFTDRDLGNAFPELLIAAGLRVERHRDHFRPDCPDAEWLEAVGRKGWIAITHDKRIRYKPNELSAVMQHGVGLLVVIGKAPFPDLARSFVENAAAVERFVAAQRPPFIAKVYRSGTVALSYPGA
jgi:hypothetical protein